MMYSTREYDYNSFKTEIFDDSFIVVTSNIDNSRSKELINNFKGCHYINIKYSLEMSQQRLTDNFVISTNYKEELDGKSYCSLEDGLDSFVRTLNEESKKIIIDISGFHIRFLGAFIATMNNYRWDAIYCSYTESIAYPREKDNLAIGLGKSVGRFDLFSSFWGFEEIPILKTTSPDRSDFIWIVFLGFEGKRADSIYTEISDDIYKVIPVISIPAIRPGWSNYAFDANQLLFEHTRLDSRYIEYTAATNPFATYNLIEQIKEKYPKNHLVISPLGTRPIALGAILYVMHHEEAELYYDTPKDACSKTIKNGTMHFYDILSFFNKE